MAKVEAELGRSAAEAAKLQQDGAAREAQLAACRAEADRLAAEALERQAEVQAAQEESARARSALQVGHVAVQEEVFKPCVAP